MEQIEIILCVCDIKLIISIIFISFSITYIYIVALFAGFMQIICYTFAVPGKQRVHPVKCLCKYGAV